ncbi:MAG: metallophosphoesterase [Ktedonobacterales bacterium]
MATGEIVRLAAVGDIHTSKTAQGQLAPLFAQVSAAADILLLAGDLTDYGLLEEAHVLVKELSAVRIPVVAVLGNHDYESGKAREIGDLLCEAGVKMLDGESIEVMGVGIAGVKGFAGGFGRGALGLWGEDAIKAFVREAIDEALKLESALARLRTPHTIALLHYAPIRATVEGEPCEIWPYLGSSRLEEPLARYPVEVVFHGHAHHGSPEGKLHDGTPVYNVSQPLLKDRYPDRPAFRIVELPATPGAKEQVTPRPALA